MEQRLIDANALEKKILKRGAYKICTDDVVAMIADAPTVDAVPMVRCMECKYMRESVDGLFKSGYFCERCHITSDMENCDDFYCADGERRTE